MTSVVVVGTQWGDEGKGKITDFLSANAEVIARYQRWGQCRSHYRDWRQKVQVALIPSGIFFPEKISVIGNGVVVNPKSLVKELAYLHEEGVTTDSFASLTVPMSSFLTISNWTVSKKSLKAKTKSERPSKGLDQPTWTRLRVGIRIADLLDRDVFAERLRINLEEKNRQFQTLWCRGSFLWRYLRRILWIWSTNQAICNRYFRHLERCFG